MLCVLQDDWERDDSRNAALMDYYGGMRGEFGSEVRASSPEYAKV